ncbi:hypothetical protein GCM10007937_01800 [Mesorhizobium albiziae]|nr:hypothetical protein GCM10007937_01800 [Mesorhizobium albiziae]
MPPNALGESSGGIGGGGGGMGGGFMGNSKDLLGIAREKQPVRLMTTPLPAYEITLADPLESLGVNRPASTATAEVAELTVANYEPELVRCTLLFFSERSGATHKVNVADPTGVAFDLSAKGKSPALSISEPGFREHIRLEVRFFRSLENAKLTLAHVASQEAYQTPWPDGDDSEVPTSKLEPFSVAHITMLDDFVRTYTTTLHRCVGSNGSLVTYGTSNRLD